MLALGAGWYLADRAGVSENSTPSEAVATASGEAGRKGAAVVGNHGSPVLPSPAAASGTVASAAVAEPMIFSTGPWKTRLKTRQPLKPGETVASRAIRAEATVVRKGFPLLTSLKKGDVVSIPLRDGATAQGTVNLVKPEASGWVRVGGSLKNGQKGSFSLSQRGDEFTGMVRLLETQQAFLITTDSTGKITMLEKPLRSVQCLSTPKKPRAPGDFQAIPGGGGPEPTAYVDMIVPELDTVPGATAVLYLDFDGELVDDPDWNSGFPVNARPAVIGTRVISQAMISDIVARVAEDMSPFNISVTTLRDRYDNAPVGSRMRCVVTSTSYWMPDAGGVAFLESFAQAGNSFADDVPCWAFAEPYYTALDLGIIISHEAGHTFGLSHDSLLDASGTILVQEYFPGHGNWVPLMGASFSRTISQWSKCEFRNGGNYDDIDFDPFTGIGTLIGVDKEDDVAIISGVINGFGYRADDHDNVMPASLHPNTGIFNMSGRIESELDVDVFKFEMVGGTVVVNVTPASQPNLNVRLEIKNSSGTRVGLSDATGNMAATLTQAMGPGVYTLHVLGAADGIPLTNGFSTYGSIGQYTITGTFPALPDTVPSIITDPVSVTVASGQKAAFSVEAVSNIGLTYQWTLDGNPINGANKSVYSIAKAGPTNIGTYRCIVTNSIGPVTSDAATLSLNFKPIITQKPLPVTVGAGGAQPLTLSVTALGTETINYQWQKNDVNVGTNSPTFTVASPVFQDAGTYRCIVSNAFGSVTSPTAKVVVTSVPVITVEPPSSKGAPLGGSTTLSVLAVGTPTLKYQWFKGSTAIPTGKAATLKLSGVSAATAGDYHCVVTNLQGSDTSEVCTVTVGAPPLITDQPDATTVDVGQPLTLSVVASGDPTLTYQWQRDGVNIPGTDATLTIPAAAWADKGVYKVMVSNSFGTVASKTAVVTINSLPIILTDPISGKLARNKTVKLSVVAGGSPSLKYQWYKDGIIIPTGKAASYTYKGVATASFYCTVTNLLGSDTSATATITVEDSPKITALPASKPAPIDGTFTYAATVVGSPVLQYQWKRNKLDVPGQTSATLTLNGFTAADAGSYTLTAWNDVGVVTSNAMKVTAQQAPEITQDPVDSNAYAYQTVVFEVKATGSATLAYQWMRNGSDILTTSNSTAKTSKLTLTSVGAASVGNYTVRVSNAVGSVVSSPAVLSVAEVAVPVLTTVTPSRVATGHYVQITGSNLNWTTSVRMIGTNGSVAAPHVIVSPTELLITVPALAAGNYQFIVNTRGGTQTTASSVAVVAGSPHDLFQHARFIPAAGATITGNLPNSFTREAGEPAHAYVGITDPDYFAEFSGWHVFTPQVSGTYVVSTEGSGFDTRIGIYSGSSVTTLTELGSNDDVDSGTLTSYTRFEATAGESYFIAVDGYNINFGLGNIWLQYGNYNLTVALNTFSLPQGMPAKQQAIHGAVEIVEASDTAVLGGDGANGASVAWASLPVTGEQVQYAAKLSFSTETGSKDQMGITASDASGGAMFGLNIDASTGQVSLLDQAGTASPTGQTLVAGHDYDLLIRIDTSEDTWAALLNGAIIGQGFTLPAAEVATISSQWLPGAGAARATFMVKSASAAASE